MASIFDSLPHVARRVSKLERLVKYILSSCCDYAVDLPEVDFIVDCFDRGDAGELGRYWSDRAAFQLRSGRAVSFKGHTAEREEWLGYLSGFISLGTGQAAGNVDEDSAFVQSRAGQRVSRIVSALVPSEDVFTERTLAAYQALLSSSDHTVEIGFSVVEQEIEANPPGDIPSDGEAGCYWIPSINADYPLCYTSVASQLRPVVRYAGQSEKTGITVKADFGDTKGYEWTITNSATISLPAFNLNDGTYIWTGAAESLAMAFNESRSEDGFVAHNLQLATFGQTEIEGTFVLNEPAAWLVMDGFRFPAPPYAERGWDGVIDLECAHTEWGAPEIGENASKCRLLSRYHISSETTVCWIDDAVCTAPGCYDWDASNAPDLPPAPLYLLGVSSVGHYPFPQVGDSPARVRDDNVMRVRVKGNQVTVTVNGTTVASYTQTSVAAGRQVGMFAAGDVITFAEQAGLSAYPTINYIKAWADGVPEPSPSESGHGVYVNGNPVWMDAYHDEEGNYNPLALDG